MLTRQLLNPLGQPIQLTPEMTSCCYLMWDQTQQSSLSQDCKQDAPGLMPEGRSKIHCRNSQLVP